MPEGIFVILFNISILYINFFVYFISKYYLVDDGYPNRNQFIALYHGVWYHLKEFGLNYASPQDHKELFNLPYASLIERLFGDLEEKFCIFQSLLQYPKEIQSNVIIAACLFLNFITEHKGGKDQL